MLVSLIHFCRQGHTAQAQDHRSRNAARVIPTWPPWLGNPITEFPAESCTLAIPAGAVDRSHDRRRTQTLQGGGRAEDQDGDFTERRQTEPGQVAISGGRATNQDQPRNSPTCGTWVRAENRSVPAVSPGRLSLSKEVTWATITRPEKMQEHQDNEQVHSKSGSRRPAGQPIPE